MSAAGTPDHLAAVVLAGSVAGLLLLTLSVVLALPSSSAARRLRAAAAAAASGCRAWVARASALRQMSRAVAALPASAPAVPGGLQGADGLEDLGRRLRAHSAPDGRPAFSPEHVDTVIAAAEQGPAALMLLLGQARDQAAAARRTGARVPRVPGPAAPSDYRRPSRQAGSRRRKRR
jgi:hypothetical protein